MSAVIDMKRPTRRVRRSGSVPTSKRPPDRAVATRGRLAAAIVVVELLFVLGLVVAIPHGRGAVAVVFVLSFALAMSVGARVNKPRPSSGAIGDADRPSSSERGREQQLAQ